MRDSPLLILLVGSNPLPNYLAACALQPGCIALVFTEETQEAKDRLRTVLSKKLGERVTFKESIVEDATCATTVKRVLDSLMENNGGCDIRLNYTGGTKVMAAHARLAFLEAEGKPEDASYLDEGRSGNQPRLRFDNGRSKPLSDYPEIPLTLESVLKLHGITYTPRKKKEPAPTAEDAKEILCKVLADPRLATNLYDQRKLLEGLKKPDVAISDPFQAADYGLTLSLPAFPTEEQLSQFQNSEKKESWFKQWYAFIGGEWLEEWLGAQICRLGLTPAPEITVGVNAQRGDKKAQLEVDIAVIRGHRSYFISCTTDTTKSICKSKLFEVIVRSQHLGGDLARAAMVCLVDDTTVSALQQDVNDVWGASNTARVFGLSDLRAWSDCDGNHPNWYSLKEWLES
jgi:hypothetical protein